MIELSAGADRILLECAGLRRGERVLILLDALSDEAVAGALRDAAKRARATPDVRNVDVDLLSPDDNHVQPEALDPFLSGYDVVIGVTSRSLYHSILGRRASSVGKRVLALTGCSIRSMTGGAIEADFAAIEGNCRQAASLLGQASRISITTTTGTDLTGSLAGRSGYANTGRAVTPGDRTGCLDVEAFIAPIEDSVDGVLVADASTTLFGMIDEPVTLHIENGRVRSCQGGRHAAAITRLIAEAEDSMSVVAEFGFGMNPSARVVGDIIQDEATCGTGHMAIGSNDSFGGRNRAPLHFDLVYWAPNLLLDGDMRLIDAGTMQLPR